jgi:hypothetical protein
MQTWLFQALHDLYPLVDEIPARLGTGDWWEVTQNWKYMKPGERAILWQSDPDAGIYALGELADKAYATTESESGWRVDIEYQPLLKHPLLKTDLLDHPILKDLLIIRVPNSRNPTLVSEDQWLAIEALIATL